MTTYPSPVRPPTPRPVRRRRVPGEALAGWGFVAPALVVVGGLTLFPAVWALVLSFRRWDGFSPQVGVGTQNYRDLFSDPSLLGAALHTVLYTAMFVPASLLLGLTLATALNRRIRFIGFYRTAVFVPFVVSAAATGILTTYLFSPQFGLVNNVLRVLHLPQQGWLEDSGQAMVVITIMSLWGQAAFTTVIYLAALQDVPHETVEAARIDGANSFQVTWRVVWPQLRPVTVFVGVYQTLQALQLFDLVYATTRGGPLEATQTIVYLIWTTAFQQLQFGYGSAIAYALFVVTLAVTVAVTVTQRRAARRTR
ncbi:carbohydrate ABC transporter permease [Kineococcus sp. TBRC 1896]|uniref:Carbohydrate ABC transporter permease n=1 Tax=Kineococcus mangrovi TaxID=1660183 RepID=A0ABV4HXH1_9ACTN